MREIEEANPITNVNCIINKSNCCSANGRTRNTKEYLKASRCSLSWSIEPSIEIEGVLTWEYIVSLYLHV